MEKSQAIFILVQSGVVLITLWIVVTFLYKDFILDSLRQKLFSLRDELFLIAANEKSLFKNEAYKLLRDQINSHIRYAHKLDFVKIIFFFFFITGDVASCSKRIENQWKTGLAKINVKAQSQLENLKSQVENYMFSFLIKNSFSLMFLLSVLFVVVLPTLIIFNFVCRNFSFYKRWSELKSRSQNKVASTVFSLSEFEDDLCRA